MRINIDPEWLLKMCEVERQSECISAGITPNGLIAEVLAGNMTVEQMVEIGTLAGILVVDDDEDIEEPLTPSPPIA